MIKIFDHVWLQETEAEARIGDERSTDVLKLINSYRDLVLYVRQLEKALSPIGVMTPEEFEKKMQEILGRGDPEGGHIDADDLMCKRLTALGYSAGVKVFEGMHKWYA
jgi:hypothetical protein